jgi:hypothetical protein
MFEAIGRLASLEDFCVAPGTYTAELKSGTYRGQQPATLRTGARVTITVR